MSEMNRRIEKIKGEFAAFPTWEDRYKHLIEKGKSLAPFPESERTEDHKVRGCQSQVWLIAKLDAQNRVQFQADSDAMIVKGLVALLLEVYSQSTPDEILATSPVFLKDLGFESHLSPSRANGLFAMARQIMNYGLAFQTVLKMRAP